MSSRVIDRNQIRHVAQLAELRLSDEEEARFTEEVARIVAYVAELEAIDTTDVPPTAHVTSDEQGGGGGGGLRPDEHVSGLSHDQALAGAPRAAHGGFSVPTFVE
jgi:aspartyl-tRNA(Asn)/glutamyl-tRNA(Gln) amidotransferase subunit C